MTLLDSYARDLAALDAAHLRRTRRNVQAMHGTRLTVNDREMLAFCSNDCLGLAQHPALVEAAQRGAAQWGIGATASPLARLRITLSAAHSDGDVDRLIEALLTSPPATPLPPSSPAPCR